MKNNRLPESTTRRPSTAPSRMIEPFECAAARAIRPKCWLNNYALCYRLQIQMVIISGAALVMLLVATALAVYKPRGMTAYGRRKQGEQRKALPRSRQERAA